VDRLRVWTTTAAVGAAGLVALFSILAASSFPGHSGTASSSTSNSPSTSIPAQQSSGDQGAGSVDGGQADQPQAPPGGFFGTGGGTSSGRGVVSGGS